MLFYYEDNNCDKPGIYKIINTHTNRIYVGQTKDFFVRWREHFRDLLKHKHKNKFLQNDFNKCKQELGHDDFLEFHIVEILEKKEDRNKMEEFYILSVFDKRKYCYNMKKRSNAKEKECFSKTPEETRKKLSELAKKRDEDPKVIEEKSKHFKQLWQNPLWREKQLEKIRSPESKKKNSISNTGKIRSKETKIKLSQSAKNRWNNMSQQEKNETVIGINNSNAKIYENIKLLSPEGVLYERIECLAIFCQEKNLNRHHMYSVLNGKRKHHKGWKILKT